MHFADLHPLLKTTLLPASFGSFGFTETQFSQKSETNKKKTYCPSENHPAKRFSILLTGVIDTILIGNFIVHFNVNGLENVSQRKCNENLNLSAFLLRCGSCINAILVGFIAEHGPI